MGELSDVFVADQADLVQHDLVVGVPAGFPVVRCAGLDPVKLGFLADALGCADVDPLEAPVAVGAEGVPVVMPISPGLSDCLARLPESDVERVAAEWAGGPVVLEDGDDGEEAVLRRLVDLAESTRGRRMYLWWG